MQGIPSSLPLNATGLNKHFRARLTPSQKQFVAVVSDWIAQPRKMLITLSGGPGTGKTFTVMQTLEQLRLDPDLCVKMAYTGRSAHAIGGRTIHSTLRIPFRDATLLQLEKQLEGESDVRVAIEQSEAILDQMLCVQDPRIVIVDEVGMISGWLIYWLVRFFMDRTDQPLLFVAMGDRHQLTPVRSKQNMFSIADALKERYEVHVLMLTENNRFDSEYEQIIHKLTKCVDRGDEAEMFALVRKYFPVTEDVKRRTMRQATRAMAFKNATVDDYNQHYLHRKLPGDLIKVFKIENNRLVQTQFQCLKEGCLLFATQNTRDPRVSNGTQLRFKRYDSQSDVLHCTLWTEKPGEQGNDEVTVHRVLSEGGRGSKSKYDGLFPVELGFAGTVHKFQGQTMDDSKIVINFDGNRDLHLVYTALSRVRGMKQILAVQL